MGTLSVVPAALPDPSMEKLRALQQRLLQTEEDLKRAGDPSAEMFGALSDFSGEMCQHRLDMAALVAAVREVKRPAATLTDDQIRAIGIRVAAGSAIWVPQLHKSRDRQRIAQHVVALVVSFIVGASLVWWVAAPPRGMQCGYSTIGQWACWAPAPTKGTK